MPSPPSARPLSAMDSGAAHSERDFEADYLLEHVQFFAESACTVLRDMFDTQAAVSSALHTDAHFRTRKDMCVGVLYTGSIHGEYLLALDVETLASIAGMDTPTSAYLRSDAGMDFFDPICESLNVAVGAAIEELSEHYSSLTFASPRVLYGVAHYPRIPTASAIIDTPHGEVECHFYVNKQKLELEASYQQALEARHKAIVLAQRKQQTIDRIMANISSSIFTIDASLKILPGMTHATRRILQLDDEEPEHGWWDFPSVIGHVWSDAAGVRRLIDWLHLAFSPTDDMAWYEEVANRRGWDEIRTRWDRTLRFRWAPLRQEDGRIDCVMVIVEDVTAMTPEQAQQLLVNDSNDASVAMLGRLLDLNVDDVVSFVQDGCQARIMADALGATLTQTQSNLSRIEGLLKDSTLPGDQLSKLCQHEIHALRDDIETPHFDAEDERQTLVQAELSLCEGQPLRVDSAALDHVIALTEQLVAEQPAVCEVLEALHAMAGRDIFDGFSVLQVMCERLCERAGVSLRLNRTGAARVGARTHHSLLQAMVLLLRNAVEGCASGKSAGTMTARTISISARESGDTISLMIRDDGGRSSDASIANTAQPNAQSPPCAGSRLQLVEQLISGLGGSVVVVREGLSDTIAEMRVPRGC